jgi:hypothetical protein
MRFWHGFRNAVFILLGLLVLAVGVVVAARTYMDHREFWATTWDAPSLIFPSWAGHGAIMFFALTAAPSRWLKPGPTQTTAQFLSGIALYGFMIMFCIEVFATFDLMLNSTPSNPLNEPTVRLGVVVFGVFIWLMAVFALTVKVWD